MSAIRCSSPGCGGTEGYAVREVYEWHRGFRWWLFWRGVAIYRVRIGDCVVCCRCDMPFVHANDDSFLTQKAMARLGVPTLRPVGSPDARMEAQAKAQRDGYRPVELVP